MANVYDRPIPIDISIDPYKLPIDSIDKSLAKQQENFNSVLKTYDDGLNTILSITGRPGNLDDENFVRGLYDKAKPQALDVLSKSEGQYSPLTSRNLQEEFEKVLVPNREQISALVRAKQVFDERKALDAAESQGKAILLRYDNDILEKPVVNPDGTVNDLGVGAKVKLDWYGGIGKLFEKMTLNERLKKKLGDADTGTGITTIRSWLHSMKTYGKVYDENGVEDTMFTDVLENVMREQVNTFIVATDEGAQMYDWFKHENKRKYKLQNPTATPEQLEAYGHEMARKEIEEHIYNYGEKFKGQGIVREETQQSYRTPSPTNTTPNDGGGGEEAGDPAIEFSMLTERAFAGSDISGIDIEKTWEDIDRPYRRFESAATTDSGMMTSLRQIQEVGSQVGPDDAYHLGALGLNKIQGHQFANRSSATKGFLQQLGDAEIDRDYKNKSQEHPTVIQLTNKADILAYKKFLEDSGKKNTQEYKDLEGLFKEGSDPKLQQAFFTSLVTFEEDDAGNLQAVINPFMKQQAAKNPAIAARIKKSQEWLADPEVASRILKYTIPYTKLQDKRRAMFETMNNAAINAGFSSFKAMKDGLSGSGKSIKTVSQESTHEYYKSIMSDTRPGFTEFTNARGLEPIFDYFINDSKVPGTEGFNLKKVGYAIMNDVTTIMKNPESYKNITGENATPDVIRKRYIDMIEKDLGKPLNDLVKNHIMKKGVDDMLNGLTDVLSKINSNKKTAINVGGVLQQAREAKREYFSKNIRENSNQYLRYFDELESKKDNFYVEGFSHIFGEAGNTEYKHLMGNLKGIVEASPYSFRVMPKGKEDFKRAFSLQDAIESTIPSNVKDAERQKAYQTAYAGLKVTAITYDLDNGVVIDYMVNGEKFEVRPNAEQITTLLSTRGASPRNLDKFKQITSTLKENNNTMGYIGEPNRKSRQTQFFVQQKDDATGIKKGQYYIYENGNKKAFASVQELMDWHTKNKEENYRAFEKAGTMLAMNPVEFAQAYPNVDRKELEIYMTKLFADDVKNSQLAIVAARAGHDVDDLEVVKVTDDKDKIVMKRPEDPNKTVDDKHVDVVDGKRLVRYEPLKSTKGMVELTPNDPTVLIGPFRELVEELGAKWADSGNAPFGITNSLRDIQQQEKLYANDPTYTKGTVSPHMEGMAVDIRVKDNAGIALVAWFKGEDGKKWLKDNNLAVLVHKVPGNADHIHLQYNKKLGTSNVLSYLFKDERDGTIITK